MSDSKKTAVGSEEDISNQERTTEESQNNPGDNTNQQGNAGNEVPSREESGTLQSPTVQHQGAAVPPIHDSPTLRRHLMARAPEISSESTAALITSPVTTTEVSPVIPPVPPGETQDNPRLRRLLDAGAPEIAPVGTPAVISATSPVITGVPPGGTPGSPTLRRLLMADASEISRVGTPAVISATSPARAPVLTPEETSKAESPGSSPLLLASATSPKKGPEVKHGQSLPTSPTKSLQSLRLTSPVKSIPNLAAEHLGKSRGPIRSKAKNAATGVDSPYNTRSKRVHGKEQRSASEDSAKKPNKEKDSEKPNKKDSEKPNKDKDFEKPL